MRIKISRELFLKAFFLLVIGIHFIQIIFFQQSYFLNPYDYSYWKDRYEHSQYQLPLSKRIIGDDGLFAYAGYRVIKGDDPFSINVDKPPLGKYAIGLFIVLFNNPAYYALFFGAFSIILFYLIAKKLLQNLLLTYVATILLFLDPLFFSQFWKPWLDILQLFLFLLNILIIIQIKEEKNIFLSLLCGISLGLFLEIKPPILFPIIFALETFYIFSNRLFKQFCLFSIGIGLGMVIPYLAYLNSNGIVTFLRLFLKLHKYMYSIYYQSQLKVNIGAIWQVLGWGNFPDITTGLPTRVSEWSIFWPICTILVLLFSIKFLFNSKSSQLWKLICIFILLSLLVFTFIPSYTRYLIILLPFIYIVSVKSIDGFMSVKIKTLLFILISVFSLIRGAFFLYPYPDNILDDFYYNFSHLYFQDIYQEDISKNIFKLQDREEFRVTNQKLLADATVKSINIQELERNIPVFSNTGTIKIRVTYKTQDLGPFIEDKTIYLVKEDDQWKIKWNWNIVLNGFLPNNYIEAKIKLGKRGSIFDHSRQVLAQDTNSYLVSVNPDKIKTNTEQEMLNFISRYVDKDYHHLRNEYLENPLPNTYIPLFTLYTVITDKDKIRLLSYSGVKLTEYLSRIDFKNKLEDIDNTSYKECCTRIYSSYNYHGISGDEKKYDSILDGYSGGTIELKDTKGSIIRTIIEKKEKNGNDVFL